MSRVSFRSLFFLWSRRGNIMILLGIVFHCNDKSSDYVSAYMCASWIYTCIHICICLFLFFYSIIHVHLTRSKNNSTFSSVVNTFNRIAVHTLSSYKIQQMRMSKQKETMSNGIDEQTEIVLCNHPLRRPKCFQATGKS